VAPVQVAPLEPHVAAQLLAGIERHAPRGMPSAGQVQAMCERGLCFGANVGNHSQMAYVLQLQDGKCWISAAGGRGAVDLTQTMLPAIELQVSGAADSLAFLTGRRGLVKKAQALGYEIRGWVLQKDLQWT
jgi:hypothetical protein